MDADEIKQIDELFKRHLDVISENCKNHVNVMFANFQHKLDIVVEGHQMLSEKIDRLDNRMDGFSR